MSWEEYPNITVASRCSVDGDGFSVEVRHDDEGDWETYFNGNNRDLGVSAINTLLKQFPSYKLLIGGHEVPLAGYLFSIRKGDDVEKFFKPLDKVRSPFYNRKVYANTNPEASVSFIGLNL